MITRINCNNDSALGALLLVLSGCGQYAPPAAPVVARDPLDVPPPIHRTSSTTVDVNLTAVEGVAELAPGRPAIVWTFDGTIPGPLIRVREGDLVALRLTNLATNVEPHCIDLHALAGVGGGCDATDVAPGETKELRFVAERQGTYFYHCAAEGMPWEHLAHGMYGAILVEPPGGLAPVDAEIYVAQSEWYLTAPEGGGPADLDVDAARRAEPSLFTFNGNRRALASPAIFGDRVHVPAGGHVRIVFADAGPNLPSSLHVVGGIFDAVYSGRFDAPLHDEETVLVPPGSAAVFELTLSAAGDYALVDHALYHAERGALGLLHADP